MARPKKIIARTKVRDNQYQICIFRRQGKNKWHINKILIDDAPLSLDKAKEIMKEFSEQLKIPWLQKPLQDVTRKRLHNSAKRKARKEKLRIARALKPPLITFDGSSLGRPGCSASRQSLGTAVFGGMVIATVLSLFIVPILYIIVASAFSRRDC